MGLGRRCGGLSGDIITATPSPLVYYCVRPSPAAVARIDELVQWGKEEGPYARLRALGAGEGDSRFGAAIRESSRGSEKKVDSRGSGALHRGHK